MANSPPDQIADPNRLAALRQLGLLDAQPVQALDRWTRLASCLLHAPVAQINLVDVDRQFIVSHVGLGEPLATERQTPLSHSFCRHIVLTAAPLIVDDSRQHPLVADNPAVSDFRVIAYLGVPLTSADGHVLGALCAIDHVAHPWSAEDQALLSDFAAAVMSEFEIRSELSRRRLLEGELRATNAALETRVRERTRELVASNARLAEAVAQLENEIQAQREGEAERARLAERLHQAEKLEVIGRFASGIAHDFNNMLTAMVGEAELAALDADDPAATQEHLATLSRALDRATALTRQVLSFGREYDAEPRREQVPLQPIIREVLELAASTVGPAVALEIALDDAVPPLSVDPCQLHRVALNLLTNALQAVGAGPGRLAVDYRRRDLDAGQREAAPMVLPPGPYAVLTISDTGPGMDATTLAHIFDPFFTTKRTGTGLGLALVSRIVAAHDGAIAVSSALGDGSSFAVYLPLAPALEGAGDPGL